jgi:hypothetical protein
MKTNYIDFIGMYEDVFPENYCEHMINEFENKLVCGQCANRKDAENANKTKKDDEFYFLNLRPHLNDMFDDRSNVEIFFQGLQKCFKHYTNEYDALMDSDIICSEAKMQKTKPGGGYHIWHFEQCNLSTSDRIMTFIAYLNTLEPNCAGETELLYQKMRIPPKKNSLIIFPASYTHTHRGNVVFGNDAKYIITGWFNLN